MALRIETFDNIRGGNTLYKALTHPHAAGPARALIAALERGGPVAIVDPHGAAAGFVEIFGFSRAAVDAVYVQDITRIGAELLGHRARPVTELSSSQACCVFIAAFDAERLSQQLAPFLPNAAPVFSLDAIRLPAERLTNRHVYLDPLNFATNFAFFRDTGTLHTRIVTANYWAGYGAEKVTCWLTLFDDSGKIIAEWSEDCGEAGAAIAIDSRDVRLRFATGDFAGQLFLHVIGAAGHDVVKYALDVFGEPGREPDGGLSCTHDANAWPADRYAGLPAPLARRARDSVDPKQPPDADPLRCDRAQPDGQRARRRPARADRPVREPRHRCRGAVTGSRMAAADRIARRQARRPATLRSYRRRAAPHRTCQCRARRSASRSANLPDLARLLGKGYLLPAPVLPGAEWESLLLPTPMALSQVELPLAALVYDRDGTEMARRRLGRLPRDHATALHFGEELGRRLRACRAGLRFRARRRR